ncbi:MAG: hypothetical protein SOZ34_03120 [Clostridia bacterium]|nr:hypothetical protein [Clostridia bacterium]
MSIKKKNQEQLLNRILINIGIGILAYIFLYIMYAKFYMMPSLIFAAVFFILAVAGYILSAKKIADVKNYAHMFIAFTLCMLFTSLSRIFGTVLGIEKFMELINSSYFFKMLVNSRYEVMLVSWLGGIYLVGMIIYNSVLIYKAGNKRK